VITITDAAKTRFLHISQQTEDMDISEEGMGALRVGVRGGGCSGYIYNMVLENQVVETGKDCVYLCNGIRVVVDNKSALFLPGVIIDWLDGLMESGFKITNPRAESTTCGCGKSFR
jgi:iron-sulfur cluster assembly protein